MILLATWDCLVFVSVQHGLASLAHFVVFPNIFLHLISKLACRHSAWKACNGFTDCRYFFSPCSLSAQLCRQLFLCSDFGKSLLHPSRESRGWSQVVLHMNADDAAAAAGKDIPHVSHLQLLRGHFTDGKGRKLHRMYRFFLHFWTMVQYSIHEVNWCSKNAMQEENLVKNSENTAVLGCFSYE